MVQRSPWLHSTLPDSTTYFSLALLHSICSHPHPTTVPHTPVVHHHYGSPHQHHHSGMSFLLKTLSIHFKLLYHTGPNILIFVQVHHHFTPTTTTTTEPGPPRDYFPAPKITGVLEEEGASTLLDLLNQAGLTETLDGKGPFTLFAPSNEVNMSKKDLTYPPLGSRYY